MKTRLLIFISVILIFSACEEVYTPKPRGYFRLNFPEKQYKQFTAKNKFIIQVPTYSIIDTTRADSGWYVLKIPQLKASLYLTYRNSNNIPKELEDSRSLVYKHAVKADDILESNFINYNKKVYGSLYDIKGNVATSVNFHITDSTSKFLRGALYFYAKPNKDSLAPAINFVRKDIVKLIENFSWYNDSLK
jgi:gliding motility-associated lipoprotein GldD